MGRRPATGRLSTREELKRCIASHNLPPDRRPCCTVLNRVWWPACPCRARAVALSPDFPGHARRLRACFFHSDARRLGAGQGSLGRTALSQLGRSVTIVSVSRMGVTPSIRAANTNPEQMRAEFKAEVAATDMRLAAYLINGSVDYPTSCALLRSRG